MTEQRCNHTNWDFFLERCVECGKTYVQIHYNPDASGIGDDTALIRMTNKALDLMENNDRTQS